MLLLDLRRASDRSFVYRHETMERSSKGAPPLFLRKTPINSVAPLHTPQCSAAKSCRRLHHRPRIFIHIHPPTTSASRHSHGPAAHRRLTSTAGGDGTASVECGTRARERPTDDTRGARVGAARACMRRA